MVSLNPHLVQKIESVFYPLAHERIEAARKRNQRFVHYTSAENAVSIMKGRQVWMRKATIMNDFREIEYGQYLLEDARKSAEFIAFIDKINSVFPGAGDKFNKKLDELYKILPEDTYILSLSEHDDAEDETGRLSMWRAYGGANGVGLVVDGALFTNPSSSLRAIASPVSYFRQDEFLRQVAVTVASITSDLVWLKSLGQDVLLSLLIEACRAAILCVKHPGFREEREWRLIYSPSFFQSDLIKSSVESVNGVPQFVQKVPLIDDPKSDYYASLKSIFNKLIIGPCNFPKEMKQSFEHLLSGNSIHNLGSRIIISDIPLRR